MSFIIKEYVDYDLKKELQKIGAKNDKKKTTKKAAADAKNKKKQ